MAWTESLVSAKWTQKLNNGTSASGAIQTVNVNMGALNAEAWDVTKAGAITLALTSVLDKSIVQTIHTIENEMENET